MNRLILALLISILFSAGTASAQFLPPTGPNYGPGYRPGLSPYLNLLRGGNTAANYYLGTLPEIQRRANAQLFGAQLSELDQLILGKAPPEETRLFTPLPDSGHPTMFGNTFSYFGSPSPYANTSGRGAQSNASTLPGKQRRR